MVLGKQWVIAGSCAVLMVSAVCAAFAWLTGDAGTTRTQGISYQTGFGEQRTVTLADGTTVSLNANTWMHVAFDGGVRKISLTRGEAYFNVAEDGRPFKVSADTGEVTAQVSAFEMRVEEGEMVVSVERGRVAVGAPKDASQHRDLEALQQVAVANHRLGEVRELPEVMSDWRDGWLEFESVGLNDVIAEMDKYYIGSLWLEGEHLSQLRVSGRFHIRDMRKGVRVLARSMGLDMSMSESGDITLFERDN